MAEHLLADAVQNIPLTELQTLVPQEQSIVLINAPVLLRQAPPLEQVLEESQYRPVSVSQSAVPHGHATSKLLDNAKKSLGQNWTDEHLLSDAVQNIPLAELQALVPQEQSIVLINAPLLLGQAKKLYVVHRPDGEMTE